MANTTYRIDGIQTIDENDDLFLNRVFYNSKIKVGFGGLNYGYSSAGFTPTGISDFHDRFPFAATTVNALRIGTVAQTRRGAAGQSSSTDGYVSGGFNPVAPSPHYNIIAKFPFAADATGTDVADLSNSRGQVTGQSASDFGYTSGGQTTPSVRSNVIDKFPFASTFTTAADAGDLSVTRSGPAGQSASDFGYNSGGFIPGYSNVIDKFPFASTFTTAADAGDLALARGFSAGQSSLTHGYTCGGGDQPNATNNINDRFPFASTFTTATDIGDLTTSRTGIGGVSSTEFAYAIGGSSGAGGVNIIDRFPFATTTVNATDVGDLSAGQQSPTGNQY